MRDHIIQHLKPPAPVDPDADLRGARPTTVGDFNLNAGLTAKRPLTRAAVLVPLVERPYGLTVLLTQRTDHLHDHAGQISFPGGRMDEGDENLIDTALRETEEEIGLQRCFVQVVGYLDDYETGTGFLVTPVVGFVTPGFQLELDAFEVADAFEVPLAFIFDPANHGTATIHVRGADRHYYVFEYEHRYIWGATAGMLMNLFRRTAGDPHG